jgi:hypothetical protein
MNTADIWTRDESRRPHSMSLKLEVIPCKYCPTAAHAWWRARVANSRYDWVMYVRCELVMYVRCDLVMSVRCDWVMNVRCVWVMNIRCNWATNIWCDIGDVRRAWCEDWGHLYVRCAWVVNVKRAKMVNCKCNWATFTQNFFSGKMEDVTELDDAPYAWVETSDVPEWWTLDATEIQSSFVFKLET